MSLRRSFAWILLLALLAGPAYALGLGQIQVRSQYGEPFLAEIPVVSSDPAELRQLRARLASPEIFARIGLQPPQGLVSTLQFNVALDPAGRPVIRVSSTEPVEQPLLTFLVEADWGQGRLVREYSALLSAPDTVAAPAQPPIRAPQVDPGNRIVRPPSAPPAFDPGAAATEETEVGQTVPEAAPAPAPEPAPEPEATPAPPPAPAPQPAPVQPASPALAPVAVPGFMPEPAPASVPGEYGPVQAGDTLSQIAQRLGRDDDVSLNQMMLALLRSNPDAFIGGNINLLRQGAVLRMPAREEALRISVAEATAEVRTQVARWREMSAPVAQPQAPDGDVAASQTAGVPAGQQGAGTDARLEIAPPAADDGRQAGTRSGISAGGEGDMLRQELQDTRETLAARDAEVEELKARLTDLERLQQQQQQLITLKDSELAAAQQRLAESSQQPAPGLAREAPAAAQGGASPWPWIGLGLVLLVLAAFVWSRMRGNAGNGHSRSQPGKVATTTAAAGWPGAPAAKPAPAPARAPVSAAGPSPTWHAGGAAAAGSLATPTPAPVAPPVPPPAVAVPAPVPAPAPTEAEQPAEPDVAPLTGSQERLELARAYVELGDTDTARNLLKEVIAEGDGPESEEAARLLRELA